jgi:hypothetical protein
MINEVVDLVERMKDADLAELDIIAWGSPVPSFGNLLNSRIATLGLNPSNKEFLDDRGAELSGIERRFHTLKSLGIADWDEATVDHYQSILKLCNEYFSRNPYDAWFKRLDYLISGTALSYYFPSNKACHLDLIPFATSTKWGELTNWQRSTLLSRYSDLLGTLLKNSTIKVLILNGKSVIDNFLKISDAVIETERMIEWDLPRKENDSVPGYAYSGTVRTIGGIPLDEQLFILGFNHNIQSSYGVTTAVQSAIRNWITKNVLSIL